MGEAFLVAFLQVLVDKMAHREVFKYFGLVKGVDQKMKKWRDDLSAIGALLNQAEERQLTTDDKPLKLWLDDLRDLAYDVEDVLGKYATKMLKREIERQGHHASTRSKVWNPIPNGVFNFKMNSEIKKISERLQEISQRKEQLGLNIVPNPGTTSTKARQDIAPSSSRPDGPVIGRNEDKKQIVELLTKQEIRSVNFVVVSIVGMAGVGKTTLAGEVFKDVDETLLFKPKVWVCVSDDFNLERVTKQILESITSQQYPTGDFNRIQDLLHKELAGKKFLIVLDDVWDTCSYGQWMKLRSPFSDGAPGSKILVTTRDEEVSKMVGAGTLVHYLKTMQIDVCLKIFEQHAFLNDNNDRPPKFELLKSKIAAKCSGLPLAARTLGGLLLCKDIDEWEGILDNKLWSLLKERDILPVLRLSYHYLPSHLKRCFAYCSILPNDYEFGEKELILLWMAEGLIQPRLEDNKQMEDLGADYFRELLCRSLFQKSNQTNSKYVMHDLVGGLAQWAAGEICFRLEDKLDGNMQFKGSPNARHASYICGWYDGVKKFEAFHEVKRLRTFLPLSLSDTRWLFLARKVILDLLPQLHYLRVLSLKGYVIFELPNSIGDLRYMRYLDLSYTRITSLPESTSTLYNLQTLILDGCSNLKALPTDMSNLINLRHLDNSNVNSLEGMPVQLGRLTNLQSLPHFVVGKRSDQSGIGEIENLSHLRGTLHLSQLENVIDAQDARKANLVSKERLDVLLLEWSYSRDTRETETDVLDMLRPHGKLKELTIKGYAGKKFSTWIEVPLFSNMVIVRLEKCNNCVLLPPLGQLPSLKELHIEEMNAVESVGPEFYGIVKLPFPKLETLEFEDMENWKKWFPFEQNTGSSVFPSLKTLSIQWCPKLEGKLPENVDSLEKLKIYKCEELVVSIANYKQVCELSIDGCKGVVHTSEVEFELLERLSLSNISELMLQTGQLTKGLGKVKHLSITGCEALTSSLKNEDRLLQHLISPNRLVIEGNSGLVEELGKEAEELVKLPILEYCKLEYLKLQKCEGLSKVPKGLHHLSSLQELVIYECPSLVSFADVDLSPSLKVIEIRNCDSLVYFAKYKIPPNLTRIEIRECKSLKSLVEEEEAVDSSSSSSLEHLLIFECESLTSLSLLRGEYFPRALKHLVIWDCRQLELITSDGFFFNDHTNYCLKYIRIYNCPNLKCLPEGLCHLTNLQFLYISNCGSLVSIPRLNGGLREMDIRNCDKLEELPEDMHNNLNSLEELEIDYREGFTSLRFPPNLISLGIWELNKSKSCKRLWELELGLHTLTSLRRLRIGGEDPDVVSFPPESDDMVRMEMLLPKSLTHLSIWQFPNLKKLSSKAFQFLASLEYLELSRCPKLASIPLPEEGLPLSLTTLNIYECPVLAERCQPQPHSAGACSKVRRYSSYWPKLSHIPRIEIEIDEEPI